MARFRCGASASLNWGEGASISHSILSKIVSCRDCDDFYIKRSVDYMTENVNISKHSRRVVKHQPLRMISLQLDTILNGTILAYDVHCKMIKGTLLIRDLKPS